MSCHHRRRATGAAPRDYPGPGPLTGRLDRRCLPLILVVLAFTSAWTGWVNVMAMHTYLDRPGTLPGATWAVPIAVQVAAALG